MILGVASKTWICPHCDRVQPEAVATRGDFRCECGWLETWGRKYRDRRRRPLNPKFQISNSKSQIPNCATCPASALRTDHLGEYCDQSGRSIEQTARVSCPLGFWGPRRILWLAKSGETRSGGREDRPTSKVTRWDVTEATGLEELQEAIADTAPAVVCAKAGTISPAIWARLRAQNRHTRFIELGAATRMRFLDPEEIPSLPPLANISRLAVVTCFFNPHRGRRRVAIYPRFAAAIREQGLPLFCVEGLFGDQQSEVDSTWQVAIDPEAQFWHKESLINWAVDRVPDQYDAVMWIDADVIYQQSEIGDRTLDQLAKFAVVQPWSTISYVGPDDDPLHVGPPRPSMAWLNRDAARPNADPRRSYPGMAWAARRETLEQCGGMYTRGITGGGDVAFAAAAMNDARAICIRHWSDGIIDDVYDWGRGLAALTGGLIGCVDAHVHHLYHGRLADRQYTQRNLMFRKTDFDPRLHLELDSQGMLRWSQAAPVELREWVRNYMHSRREDDA